MDTFTNHENLEICNLAIIDICRIRDKNAFEIIFFAEFCFLSGAIIWQWLVQSFYGVSVSTLCLAIQLDLFVTLVGLNNNSEIHQNFLILAKVWGHRNWLLGWSFYEFISFTFCFKWLFSDPTLRDICTQRCEDETLECILQCSSDDASCVSNCLREDTKCIERKSTQA